jgi:hypothetical protein
MSLELNHTMIEMMSCAGYSNLGLSIIIEFVYTILQLPGNFRLPHSKLLNLPTKIYFFGFG